MRILISLEPQRLAKSLEKKLPVRRGGRRDGKRRVIIERRSGRGMEKEEGEERARRGGEGGREEEGDERGNDREDGRVKRRKSSQRSHCSNYCCDRLGWVREHGFEE